MYVIGTEQIVAYLIKLPQMLTWQNNTAEKNIKYHRKIPPEAPTTGVIPCSTLVTVALGRMPPLVTVAFESLTISKV